MACGLQGLHRRRFDSCERCCHIEWIRAFDSCFHDVRAPYLEELNVVNLVGTAPSREVLEAAPALKIIDYVFGSDSVLDAAAFQPVIDTLRRGDDLQNLQHMY